MDRFLEELAVKSGQPTGQELARRSLAVARQMGRQSDEEGDDRTAAQPGGNAKFVDPFSLELYFDAFIRKLNRSAAFVKNEPRGRGSRTALVEISLNADGSLRNYRILRAADQQTEIAYVKSVLDRASPFSAFPPDLRKAMGSLAMRMCIYPSNSSDGGSFSRSFGTQDCQD